MTDQRDEQLQRLAQALRNTQLPPDAALRRLAETLVDDDSYSHEQAEQDLPGYVSAALVGQPAAQQYPALHRHLLHCQECAKLHVAMLQDLTVEPARVAVPQPDLFFLPGAYTRRLRRAVLRLAQQIGAVLFPDSLSALADVADLLLDELQDLGPNLRASPAAGAALAFGSGDLPDEIKLLAATWAATGRLGETLNAGQIASLQEAGAWPERARSVALQAAVDLGFGPRQAERFAREFAALAASDPAAIPTRTTS
ncbi:MAG: hypothetical protein IAE85_15865 [Anaerolinea sp.]|nr:hypothetical protein [Anaerolinea sp.]